MDLKRKGFLDFIIFFGLFLLNIGLIELIKVFGLVGIGEEYGYSILICVFVLYILLKSGSKEYNYILFFYILLLLTSFYSRDTLYGIQKSFGGVLIPLFVFFIFKSKKNWDVNNLIKYFIFSILLIDFVALAYKIPSGFFNRSVNFGLLGPIPFGWINGMALIIVGLKKNKSNVDYLLILFFILMLLWSGSKGPLLLAVFFLLFYFQRVFKISVKMVIFLIGFIMFSSYLISNYGKEIRLVTTIIEFLDDPQGYSSGKGQGSVGDREHYINLSLETINDSPIFGVGLGGWPGKFIPNVHKYPHNVYLEVFAEIGIIGFFLFVFMIYKYFTKTYFGIIGLYGLTTLLVSGDLSYFRYGFYFLLIGYYLSKQKKNLVE